MNKINILDFGYVKLRNLSGPTRRIHDEEQEVFDFKTGEFIQTPTSFDADDVDPAQTARVCFDNLGAERTRDEDLKLYEYLIAHQHTSPIEMIETWWEIKVPMFIGEQILRHRTASINKISGRYSILPEEFYIPEVVRGKGGTNKQGSEDNLDDETQSIVRKHITVSSAKSYDLYKSILGIGVAPELARMVLPANVYTHFVYKQDLHNLMHFMSLRLDDHAQYEVQVVSQAMYDLLKQYLPKSMEFFDKYKRKFTAKELQDLSTLKSSLEQQIPNLEELLTKVFNRIGVR